MHPLKSLVVITACLALSGLEDSAVASFAGKNGSIAYVRGSFNEDSEIFSISASGEDRVRLTRNGTGDFSPSWSPNGKRLAYECNGPVGDEGGVRHGNICVMTAAGKRRRALVSSGWGEHSPSWASDGESLVFSRYLRGTSGNGAQSDIFRVAINGERVRRLTRSSAQDFLPEWSPQKNKIAFVSDRSGRQDIFVMRANGTHVRNVTRSGAQETDPSWSPNGRRLVLSRYNQSDANWYLVVMLASGRDEKAITASDANLDLGAAWSPNGKWIVFSRDDDLFKIRPNGEDATRVTGSDTSSKFFEATPSWRSM